MGNVIAITRKGAKIKDREKKALLYAKPLPETKHTRVSHMSCGSSWIDSQKYPPNIVDDNIYPGRMEFDKDERIFRHYTTCPICNGKAVLNYYPDDWKGRIRARAHLNLGWDIVFVILMAAVVIFGLIALGIFLFNTVF